MVLPTRIYSRIVEEEQHQICAWNLSNEHTVHDVDDEDECRLLVHRRKHDVQHPVRTVELPQAAMIASFQDESSPVKVALCAIITNSCGGPQQSRSRLRTVVTVLANRTLSKLYMHSSTATKSVYPRIVLIRGELLKVTFPAVQPAN